METKTAVFDASRPVTVNLRTPDGMKTIRVRFPTDEEWIDRQRKRKVIVKQLGRGVSETTIPDSQDVDGALLAKIRVGEDDGPVVDPFEAGRVIEQLSQAEVDDVVSSGDGFRVTLRVLGGTVTHELRSPSAKDVFEYRRGFARVLDLPYNRQELVINLAPAATLFRKLIQSSEGYAGDVPIIHQAVAVKAAMMLSMRSSRRPATQTDTRGVAGTALPALSHSLGTSPRGAVRSRSLPRCPG